MANELTSQQANALHTFREKIADILQPDYDDAYLVRWLKARQYNVSKAEVMLREHIEWRKSFEVEKLLDWDMPEVMRKYWPGGVFGCDKEGHPILYQLCKNFDYEGMSRCAKKSDIIKLYVYRMEQVRKACREESKKRNRLIDQSIDISDLDGFHLGMIFTPGITDALKQVFAIFEANYPESLHASYVINAPSVFAVIFTILKPFLSEETKRKVHILGRNWKDEILKVVDEDQLPACWGGLATDPDGDIYCRSHIVHGAKIPESFYTKDRVALDWDNMESTSVANGTKFDHKVEVRKPRSVLRWAFETEGSDIAFGVLYINVEANKEEEIVPVSRVNSHLVPEDGNITCPKVGSYVLRFENSYSWLHAKKLHYEVETVEPSDEFQFEQLVELESTDL